MIGDTSAAGSSPLAPSRISGPGRKVHRLVALTRALQPGKQLVHRTCEPAAHDQDVHQPEERISGGVVRVCTGDRGTVGAVIDADRETVVGEHAPET